MNRTLLIMIISYHVLNTLVDRPLVEDRAKAFEDAVERLGRDLTQSGAAFLKRDRMARIRRRGTDAHLGNQGCCVHRRFIYKGDTSTHA